MAPFIQDLRMLGFIDAGYVKSLKTAAGELDSDTLVSAGLGLRWSWHKQLNLQLDYGHDLRHASTPGAGGSKVHLSLFYGF